jgi:hypothetical protein
MERLAIAVDAQMPEIDPWRDTAPKPTDAGDLGSDQFRNPPAGRASAPTRGTRAA